MLKEGDLDNDRSWFRRAWTLQEVGRKRVIAGDTPGGPLHAEASDRKYKTELLARFHTQLQYKPDAWFTVSDLLEEMWKRLSTNPVDRIAGLAALMVCNTIPAYYESATLEDAWTALVDSMGEDHLVELFFSCPEPGDGHAKWRPLWDQAMTKPLLPVNFGGACQFLDRDEGGIDVCESECMEGLVLGLSAINWGDRHGELNVESNGGMARFQITASHTYPIPEDTYTLIHGHNRGDHSYVVGRSLSGERFEKVSVLEISDEEQETLDDLDILEWREYILV